jgi:hypothetical protein
MISNRPPQATQQASTPRPVDPRTPRTPGGTQITTTTIATTNVVAPTTPSPRTPGLGTPLPFVGSGGLTLDSPFGADSPPRAETPPPDGVHGDIELELLALADALYNLGTTAINDNTREKPGPDGQRPDKKIGMRVYARLFLNFLTMVI